MHDLSPADNRRYRKLLIDIASEVLPGGMIESGIMYDARESHGITREDMANGAKNPYKSMIIKLILIGVAVAAVGGALIGLGIKNGSEVLK